MKRRLLLTVGLVLALAVPVGAQTFTAQIQQFWNQLRVGTIAFATGRVQTSGYLNFGNTVGTNGYGFRDNAGTLQFKNSGGAWSSFPSGGIAPAAATYILQTANASLPNAQAIGALSTGLMFGTTTTGVLSAIVCATAGTVLQAGAPPTCTATAQLGVATTTSGTLALANGAGGGALWTLGSGATTAWTLTSKAVVPAQGDLFTFSNGTGQMASVVDVATGSVLISGGVGAVPSYSASPTLGTGLTTGPVQINGGSFLTNKNMYMTGTLNHVTPAAVYIDTAMTGISSVGSGAQVISLQGTFSLSGNTASVYGLDIGAATTTLNGFTLTNAAAIHISNTPTNGTNKRSIWAEAGLAQLDGGITAPSHLLGAAGAGSAGVLMDSATAPTIASGGCTSPAVTNNNGTAGFLLTLGSSCSTVKTIVLTFTAATHFWRVACDNNTSDAQQASNYVIGRATSTTAVTLTNYARTTGLQSDFTAADTLLCSARGE